MKINFLILLAASIVPLVIGFIWYHQKVFGSTWMKLIGMTEESAKKANMALIFGLSILFAFFIAFGLQAIVIHQFGIFSILGMQPDSGDPNSESSTLLKRVMELYGTSYRTFKHGAFHGTLTGIFLALPLIGTNALFERHGFKYIAINSGYWIVTLALMGGIICAFS